MSHPAGSSESLSLWIDTSPATDYPDLRGEEEADVAIVGAGITGITAAWLLAKAGRSVVLVERGRIAMSETGHTTAHIVEATDADYGRKCLTGKGGSSRSKGRSMPPHAWRASCASSTRPVLTWDARSPGTAPRRAGTAPVTAPGSTRGERF